MGKLDSITEKVTALLHESLDQKIQGILNCDPFARKAGEEGLAKGFEILAGIRDNKPKAVEAGLAEKEDPPLTWDEGEQVLLAYSSSIHPETYLHKQRALFRRMLPMQRKKAEELFPWINMGSYL